MQAILLLEDGTVVHGQSLGATCEVSGEIVFNTAMTGYEEVISDPSYLGQIVVFTTSHIGNTGINYQDLESSHMHAEAMICKEISQIPDNYRAKVSLDEYLKKQNKCALFGIDTRFLTQKIRNEGCLKGIISNIDFDIKSLTKKLDSSKALNHKNAVEIYKNNNVKSIKNTSNKNKKYKVAVFDFGIKQGILNSLVALNCDPILFPYDCSAEDIKAIQPDGLFFSNGPGDPAQLANDSKILSVMQELLPLFPSFGICLGHQLIGLAFGAKTKKLNFGHHAINHPVKILDRSESKVLMTSQNHNYILDISEFEDIFNVTHVHLNDGTLAGIRHKNLPVFSVQFHPEANPGPRDAEYIFKEFINDMNKNRNKNKDVINA
ncbi:glutamine-hydrolyzing carbamoyl-phosphate synthase small subunit [Fluviispira multicolorata]|uniref:Carbamoyl phosphate synthase small chain n=1 Tax=Fluviispira multicolorata TaxID=2654512 RepID=A0A833JDH5_9BACT|nr:glutamine-hydrolyzing carbamoyl-phosphate synthase small subunit [Fluviispira multicolorata]KAB8028511.1 glutamine-hydrolyzing carbamoyl-phosphate synthase small subunit [Fluviispira multicolorata]